MDAGCVELGVYALVHVESFGAGIDAREVCFLVLGCVLNRTDISCPIDSRISEVDLFIYSISSQHSLQQFSFIIVNMDCFLIQKKVFWAGKAWSTVRARCR